MTEHHCHDPHCHDPHCDGRHHHHEHGDAPEHAAVFAAKRDFAPAAPVSRAALEKAAETVFLGIGKSCCTDGILPGHAKGLVESGTGALSLSLTCEEFVDTAPIGDWETADAFSAFTVTLNVHLMTPPHTPLDEDALFAPFAAL